MHGKTSPVTHDNTCVFEGISSPFIATRYHSLIVEDILERLEVDAASAVGHVTGFRRAALQIHWVHIHPESIALEHVPASHVVRASCRERGGQSVAMLDGAGVL